MFDSQEEISECLEQVRAIFTKSEPPPMLFCDFDGDRVAFGCPFTGDDAKNMFAHMITMMVREKKITGFCFAAESWSTHIPESQQKLMPIYMAMPASERPYTTEIVMATFSNKNTEVVYHATLSKDKDGKRKLGEWEKMPGPMEGRFCQLWRKGSGINN